MESWRMWMIISPDFRHLASKAAMFCSAWGLFLVPNFGSSMAFWRSMTISAGILAPANELDDFDLSVRVQDGAGPLFAADDLAV